MKKTMKIQTALLLLFVALAFVACKKSGGGDGNQNSNYPSVTDKGVNVKVTKVQYMGLGEPIHVYYDVKKTGDISGKTIVFTVKAEDGSLFEEREDVDLSKLEDTGLYPESVYIGVSAGKKIDLNTLSIKIE